MSFEWTKHSPTAWEYVSDDLCACVWTEHDTVWWDVSGPKGRGTIASGCAPGEVFAAFLNIDQRMTIAKRLAETYIAGFRRGRDGRP